ncbi:MAG: zf-HC2 domain-containing protein [Holophagaceae bacterium]|nr:zf-HC2 domain-containing protein [Holophagaceae bacterium]
MTACREIQELMSTALDQALSAGDQARLASHLSSCDACRVFQNELQESHQLVRGVEAIEPPLWLASRIMARVRAEAMPQPSFWRRAVLPILLKPQYQVATLLLVGATSFYLIRNQSGSVQDGSGRDQPSLQTAPVGTSTNPEDKAIEEAAGARPGIPPRPTEQRRLREVDAPSRQEGEAKEKKDVYGFAAPPPPSAASPAPEAMPGALGRVGDDIGFVAPKPATPAAGAPGGGPASSLERDARADLAATSKKAAAAEKPRAKEEVLEDSAQAPRFYIQWEPEHPDRARQLLEQELADLGGTVLPEDRRQSSQQTQVHALGARLDGRRLPELLARLQRLGTVRSPQTQQSQSSRPGQVNLLIRW